MNEIIDFDRQHTVTDLPEVSASSPSVFSASHVSIRVGILAKFGQEFAVQLQRRARRLPAALRRLDLMTLFPVHHGPDPGPDHDLFRSKYVAMVAACAQTKLPWTTGNLNMPKKKT